MIANAAKKAGIRVPDDLENYDKKQYPHWNVFCAMQLGAPMPYPNVAFDNAKVVAALSIEEIETITAKQLLDRGFTVGTQIP